MIAATYDGDGDVLLVELVPGADDPGTEGEEVAPGVTLLYDAQGRLIGVEIIPASKIVAPEALDALPTGPCRG